LDDRENRKWWQRVRGKNRTLKGLISARRRYSARMDRMSGKKPQKRQYSVPYIAERVGAELRALKRMIRGEEEMPPPLMARLSKDLDIPIAELKAVLDKKPGAEGADGLGLPALGEGADPLQVLEHGLILSARALVAFLRKCTERIEEAQQAKEQRRR